jgi:nucleotide-binding universal stress UspA family protein
MADLYLVGVDGSEGSRRALYFAAQAAQPVAAGLLVVHVLPDAPGGDLAPQAPEVAFGHQEQEAEAAHAHMLEPLVAEARDLGIPVEIKALHGDPATVLAELADIREAKQIFIGRHGHSRVRELLFGSVLLKLAHKATVPVTLVP